MITEIIISLWGHAELLEMSWNSKINCQDLTGQICIADLMETVKLESKKRNVREGLGNQEEATVFIVESSPMLSDDIQVVTFACWVTNIYSYTTVFPAKTILKTCFVRAAFWENVNKVAASHYCCFMLTLSTDKLVNLFFSREFICGIMCLSYNNCITTLKFSCKHFFVFSFCLMGFFCFHNVVTSVESTKARETSSLGIKTAVCLLGWKSFGRFISK